MMPFAPSVVSPNLYDLKTLHLSAPGRICLFGEHQDYLGLPVIAAAIDLRIEVLAIPRNDTLLTIRMPDIDKQIALNPNTEQTYTHRRDYLRSAINILRREGRAWPQGYNVVIRGNVPINAGVSSSSAMVVAWLRFLLETAAPSLPFTPDDLARWGYQTEVTEFGDPGGMMDHYCAALGGLLRIDTRPPFAAERWPSSLSGLVLGHSLQPKATLQTLQRVRQDVTEGIALLSANLPTFELAATPLVEVEPYLQRLPADPARRLRANLVNRDLTLQAIPALLSNDSKRLGALLSAHHAQLRDGLDLSTEKIERMLEASLNAGALGGKINGSGGGGCLLVYAPGREEEVASAILREEGVPYCVHIDTGARRDDIETSSA